MATLVASASGGGGEPVQQPTLASLDEAESSAASSGNNLKSMQPEKLAPSEEVIGFLLDYVITQEPILSSIKITNKSELKIMLSDVVSECSESSCCIRDTSGALLGICLASKASIFEKQMDRLCAYDFQDEGMVIAVEFLKYLFNRIDFVYHCEESGISKPIFLMLVAVRADSYRQGYGRLLFNHCLNIASAEKCDGAVALCSSLIYHKLISPRFKDQICKIRYHTYRGMYSEPPIRPIDRRNDSLDVLLTRLP